MTPKVSIIVTTFNRKAFLTETLNSILNQSFQDFELIVVDNFSDYDFLGLIESFNDTKIRVFQNRNNGVIAANRNHGISHAKGEYLAFCDDDDLWEPEKLKLQVQILDSGAADLVYTGTLLFYESGQERVHCYPPAKTLGQLLINNPLTLSSVVTRNDKSVRFNEKPDMVGIEDYELWIQLCRKGFKLHMIESPLVGFRVRSQSYSSLSRSKNEKKLIGLKHSIVSNMTLSFSEKLSLLYSIGYSYARYIALKVLRR